MTSYASLRSAIDSMKIGAVDYISKPFEHDEILAALSRVLNDDTKSRNLSRRQPRPSEEPVTGMVGSCPQMLELFRRNRGYGDDLPRKTLVQVFDLLGNDHPLVATYRRRLYQALY